MKRILYIFIIVLLLSGCQRKSEAEAPHSGIIALMPSLSEVVWNFDDGEQSRLIGTSPFTSDPRAKGVTRVQNTGSLETIVSLRPELVLVHPSDVQIIEKLQKLGIPTIAHGMDTVDDVEKTVIDVGAFLHKEKEADSIVQKIKFELNENAERYRRTAPEEVLIIVDRLDARMLQLYIAQESAYIVDLVRGCGFDPLSPVENGADWIRIDAEKLITINPKNILFMTRSREDAKDVLNQFRENYSELDAVKSGKVMVYDRPEITVPGPEMGHRQRALCDYMNGEAY